MPRTVLKEHQRLYLGPNRALGVMLNLFKVINIDIDDSSIAVSSPNETIAPVTYQGDDMRDARHHASHHAGLSQDQTNHSLCVMMYTMHFDLMTLSGLFKVATSPSRLTCDTWRAGTTRPLPARSDYGLSGFLSATGSGVW